jgi:WD40 repeat protein
VALSFGDAGQGRVLSCGYWDDAVKVHALDSLREIASANGHIGEITCVQLGYKNGQVLITGGADGTCRVWVLENPSLVASFTPYGSVGGSSAANSNTGATGNPSASASNSGTGTTTASGASGGNPTASAGGVGGAEEPSSAGYDTPPPLVCVHVLCGHSAPVTAMSYSADLDILLSGSNDGYVRGLIHKRY